MKNFVTFCCCCCCLLLFLILLPCVHSENTMLDGCNGTSVRFTGGSGIIRSHKSVGVSDLPNRLDCWAVVEVSRFQVVKITFRYINGNRCCDYVEFYDFFEGQKRRIARVYIYRHTTAAFVSASHNMSLHFVTDSRSRSRGFVMEFEAVDHSYLTENVIHSVESSSGTVTGMPIIIGGWSGNRAQNWPIRVSDNMLVNVMFSDFSLSGGDRVELYDGSDASNLINNSPLSANTTYVSSGSVMTVRLIYSSDDVYTSTMFVMHFNEIVKQDACNKSTHVTADNGSISSHPGVGVYNYRNHLNCMWHISVSAGKRIRGWLTHRDIDDKDVQLDVWEVFDEMNSCQCEGPSLNLNGKGFLSFTNRITVRFQVGKQNSGTGFTLRFEAVNAEYEADVGVSVTELKSVNSSGTITSHSEFGVSNYDDNLQKRWLIRVPNGKIVDFKFSFVELEWCCDSVSLFDIGESCFENQMELYSTNTSFYSLSNVVMIIFRTDGSVTNSGFKLEFNAVDSSNQTVGVNLKSIIEGSHGSFTSHAGFGHTNYKNNMRKHWLIKVPHGNAVRVWFPEFQLEEWYDRVYLYDTCKLGHEIARLSTVNKSTEFISRLGFMNVKFYTDRSITDRGFRLSFEAVDAATFCNGTRFVTNGSIVSHSQFGHFNYKNNMNCTWHVTVTSGMNVRAWFSYKDLHRTDIVYFRASSGQVCDSADSPIGLSSLSDCDIFTSTSNTMTVTFRSDVSHTGKGFKIEFEAVNASQVTSCFVSSSIVNDSSGSVRLNFGHSDDNSGRNTDSFWYVTVPHNKVVKAWFNSLQLQSRCDSVVICSGSACGSHNATGVSSPLVHFLSVTNSITVRFVTGNSTIHRNFQLFFDAVDAQPDPKYSGCVSPLRVAEAVSFGSLDLQLNPVRRHTEWLVKVVEADSIRFWFSDTSDLTDPLPVEIHFHEGSSVCHRLVNLVTNRTQLEAEFLLSSNVVTVVVSVSSRVSASLMLHFMGVSAPTESPAQSLGDSSDKKAQLECRDGQQKQSGTCMKKTVLSTENAKVLKDFDKNRLVRISVQQSMTTAIGDRRLLNFWVALNGYISFGTVPTANTILNDKPTNPMVFPFWTDLDSVLTNAISRVSFEWLHEALRDSNDLNLQEVIKIISEYAGGHFLPQDLLIVTWKNIRMKSVYFKELKQKCMMYCRKESWCMTDECNHCKACKAGVMSHQVVITRNTSHSFAIFNYEKKGPSPKSLVFRAGFAEGSSKSAKMSVFGGHSAGVDADEQVNDTMTNTTHLPSDVTDNESQHGRLVVTLASRVKQTVQDDCLEWLVRCRRSVTAIDCSNCPSDHLQALNDWRYRLYSFTCIGDCSYALACYRGPHQCVQESAGECSLYQRPQCCYDISVSSTNWAAEFLQFANNLTKTEIQQVKGILQRQNFGGSLRSRRSTDAGHALLSNSTDWEDNDELDGHVVCSRAGLLPQLEQARPACGSEKYVTLRWAFTRGDPHFTTLDGLFYTFNGRCEYLMVTNTTADVPLLMVQARTDLAIVAGTNTTSNATVFTGFAVRLGSNAASVAVLLNREVGDSEIFVNSTMLGRVRENLSVKDSVTVEKYTITAANDSVLISDDSSGVAINVSVAVNFLQAALQLPRHFNASVTGLLGNFNGNPSDDLEMRNGSVLSPNATEREIFEFGETWQILSTEQRLFPNSHAGWRTRFCDADFRPTFVTDFRGRLQDLFTDTQLFITANRTCWNSQEMLFLSCMYDAALLQSQAAADVSAETSKEAAAITETLTNSQPNFIMPINITVFPDRVFTADVIVTDPDGDDVTLMVSTSPEISKKVSLNGTTLVWQVGELADETVNLTVTATDSKGAASEWRPAILLCHCVNGGDCDFSYASGGGEGGSFYLASCVCPIGFHGNKCQLSPCSTSPSPCFLGNSACHVTAGRSFACDACPHGMVGDGRNCEDADPCVSADCQHDCLVVNVSSFECRCRRGFRPSPTDAARCLDVNECETDRYTCKEEQQQKCINTQGGYNCVCPNGETLNLSGDCQNETTITAATSWYFSILPALLTTAFMAVVVTAAVVLLLLLLRRRRRRRRFGQMLQPEETKMLPQDNENKADGGKLATKIDVMKMKLPFIDAPTAYI